MQKTPINSNTSLIRDASEDGKGRFSNVNKSNSKNAKLAKNSLEIMQNQL